MRKPPNDTAVVAAPPTPDPETGAAMRKCIITGTSAAQSSLVRLAIAPDGAVLPDILAKAPGRGAWIGVDRAALASAMATGKLRGALARAFKGSPLSVPEDLPDRIAAQLEAATLNRLGLEARASFLITGGEKIAAAARAGQVKLLLHAADAGGGQPKLDQAWRVGSDREGEDLRGRNLPVDRMALSVALGRQNVVHIAIIDTGAARRVSHLLNRWLHYLGVPAPAADRAAA
ncbi:MAG: DUF448 domain-containing protein [Parasphingorhabdus sp.]|nr:DUF448 domain-containing protein [Parasphingorhabdus sp.]